jgi:hypothetical protein
VSSETNGGDRWHEYDTTVTTTGAATVPNAVYGYPGSALTPHGGATHTYGPLNLLYSTGPAP